MLERTYDAFRRMIRLLTLLGALFALFILVGGATHSGLLESITGDWTGIGIWTVSF